MKEKTHYHETTFFFHFFQKMTIGLIQGDSDDDAVPGSRSHTGVNPTMMNPGFGGRQHVYV